MRNKAKVTGAPVDTKKHESRKPKSSKKSQNASSSKAVKLERAKPKTVCNNQNGRANCGLDKTRHSSGRPPANPSPKNRNDGEPLVAGPSPKITDFGVWLKEQLERDPTHNIIFLSSSEGLDTLTDMANTEKLPSHWITTLAKLLTREEFRLSLMREHTDKIFGRLSRSWTFLLQLHTHIKTQLKGTPEPKEIMVYLWLMEDLQRRSVGTANIWRLLPLEDMHHAVEQLDDTDAKKELVAMVNRLTERRNLPAAFSKQEAEAEYLGAEFRNISIIPDKEDLLQPHVSAHLPVNLVGKPYKSVTCFLETHFRLLREDCIDPLRQAIRTYRNRQFSAKELHIYQNVQISGPRCGEQGLEYTASFQCFGEDIDWEASKRLRFGALVCLSCDGFRTSFVLGAVAQNNLKGKAVRGTRHRVSIRLSSVSRGEEPIAHDRTYVMVESTSAYFEAYYHVLTNLQSEDMENLPFTKYLLELEQHVDPPRYLLRRERGDEYDFGSVFPSIKDSIGRSTINILQGWPEWPTSLDQAQLQALKHGLTKELSIIQGPPGTGKTFLGLLLVRLLLANLSCRNGPILVICMTNHALDQFLEGIHKFEPNVIRIGARSKSVVLKNRTLRKLVGSRKCRSEFRDLLTAKRNARRRKEFVKIQFPARIRKLKQTLVTKHELSNIATQEQMQNLFSVGLEFEVTLARWLRGDMLPLKDSHPADESMPFVDSKEDALKEPEGSRKESGRSSMQSWPLEARGEKIWQRKTGQVQPSSDNLKGVGPVEGENEMEVGMFHQFQAMSLAQNPEANLELVRGKRSKADEDHVDDHSDDDDDDEYQNSKLGVQFSLDFPYVWRLKAKQRRILHDYWLGEIKRKYRQQLKEEYEKACRGVTRINDEIKLSVLRKANVVGVTTTAAARCRNMLQALNSEILIVEEAAEVLEGHVLASLNSCVKHLVLIGDHMQLRPSTAVHQLGTNHKLDVSMFERLVEGGVEHVTLEEQRRMRPSFARLVKSLYPKLKDHESVSKYENIRGVNSNLLFFDHTAEENSEDTSRVNTTEAKLVVELVIYLLKQGCYSAQNIAVLAMYSSQITEIRRMMKERASVSFPEGYLERLQTMNKKETPVPKSTMFQKGRTRSTDITELLPRVSSVDDFQGE
ncbi:hypothetical protein R1sor_007243 [Riccia sorocarpa]|uniref:AAA+ ATPase domain-containing protein n=1 Tax=Riccia sorocarpa TaxID=122646 RepID=A0ABD3HSU6_9MARC